MISVPGRVRAGPEEWLAEHVDLPGPLVESARTLADVVEREVDNSPLWGRFQRAMDQLLEAMGLQTPSMTPEAEAFLADLETVGEAELYRVSWYQAAGSNFERSRWEGIAPIGCVRGDHGADQWGRCRDCGSVLTTDGP